MIGAWRQYRDAVKLNAVQTNLLVDSIVGDSPTKTTLEQVKQLPRGATDLERERFDSASAATDAAVAACSG